MIKIHTCVAGDNVVHEGTWARVVDHWAKVLGEPGFRSQHLPPFTQVPAPLSSFFPRVTGGCAHTFPARLWLRDSKDAVFARAPEKPAGSVCKIPLGLSRV